MKKIANHKLISRYWPYLVALLLMLLFLFFRFYQIDQSLLFFNDIGRDFLVLWQWQQSGKPPLLGPQTSALPFNQSAFYFYYLYPFYLFTNGWEYATMIACAGAYLMAFALGLYYLRQRPLWQKSLLLVFALLSIHPQFVLQQRFVWNPSFLPLFLIAAFYLFLELEQRFRAQKSWPVWLVAAFALSLAAATALSYSALPAMAAFLLVALFLFRRRAWLLYLASIPALAVVNLPTLIFELRHNFLLTQMMLSREKLPQDANYLSAKLSSLQNYVFALPTVALLLFLLALAIAIIYTFRRHTTPKRELFLALILLVLTVLLTLVAPISLHAHYVFPILVLLFLSLAFLVKQQVLYWLFPAFLLFFWLRPTQLQQYFAPTYRSVAASRQCAANFCAQHQEPLFIAVQSDHHPYHNGMEWQYLVAKGGCQLRDLTTQANAAQHLAVFVDDSSFVLGETQFHELTMFGPAQEQEVFTCSAQLQIHYLQQL